MKIKEIINQNRRDFYAVYECEHCGVTHRDSGYDDRNFHENVIPEMKCKECGKKSGDNYKPRAAKYDESTTV